MKRILIGIATSSALLATVVFTTNAFFSDTETSSGNTFQAGKLDLKVDNTCHYFQNGQEVPCPDGSNWQATDLGQQYKFFNFDDVKPGDQGEDTISLHVDNNPAWACARINNITNDGQLAQNLNFSIWADKCDVNATPGDNLYQSGCDVLLTQGTGPLSPITFALADSTVNVFTGLLGALNATDTYYLGAGWNIPTTVGNEIQGDMYKADISFYTVQQRNNPNFVCTDWPMPTLAAPLAN